MNPQSQPQSDSASDLINRFAGLRAGTAPAEPKNVASPEPEMAEENLDDLEAQMETQWQIIEESQKVGLAAQTTYRSLEKRYDAQAQKLREEVTADMERLAVLDEEDKETEKVEDTLTAPTPRVAMPETGTPVAIKVAPDTYIKLPPPSEVKADPERAIRVLGAEYTQDLVN